MHVGKRVDRAFVLPVRSARIDIKPLGMPFFQGRPLSPPAPDILVTMDLDGTMIHSDGKGEAALADFLDAHRGRLLVHVATARTLPILKHTAEKLNRFHVRYITVNNGEQLYANTTGLALGEWVRQLHYANRSRAWAQAVRQQTGWVPHRVYQLQAAILKQAGFSEPVLLEGKGLLRRTGHLPNGRPLNFEFYPGQCTYSLSTVHAKDGPAVRAYGQQLASRMIAGLAAKGMPARFIEMRLSPLRTGYSFSPGAVDKASVIDFLLQKHPGIKAVITAGDQHNLDGSLLSRPAYTGADGKPVPNYPVISGYNRKLMAMVPGPRKTQVPMGTLQVGLARQIRRIDRLA